VHLVGFTIEVYCDERPYERHYCTFLNPVRSNAKVSKFAYIGVAILHNVVIGKQGVCPGVGSCVISGTLLHVEHHFAPRA